MCFDFRTSIVSYTLGMISGILALWTRQYVLGCLILCFCQMQLSEAMIWYGLDHQDERWNQWGTRYGQYLLPAHNLAISVGLWISMRHHASSPPRKRVFYNKRHVMIALVLSILFYVIIVTIVYPSTPSEALTYPYAKNPNVSCRCADVNHRLKWPYPHAWYGYSFLFSIGLYVMVDRSPFVSKVFLLSMFIMAYVAAILLFHRTVGSMFCFFTAILSPMLVFINYFLTR